MRDRRMSAQDAVAQIPSGATVMVGGFGSPGTPFSLLDALRESGVDQLTLVKNDANEVGVGVSHLIASGQVKKLITSHLGLNRFAIEQMKAGELEVEFVPQGILAERVRSAGVGLPAFLSDVGVETEISQGEELIELDGARLRLERAIKADYALIHASIADRHGNLRYAGTAMNFNPLMAMAADCAVAEVAEIRDMPLPPDQIHTPGIFVDQLVAVSTEAEAYQLMEHHIHA